MKKFQVIVACFICIFVIFSVFYYFAHKETIFYEQNKSVINIRLYSNWSSDNLEGQCFQKIIDNFNNANPDINIVNDVQLGDDYFHQLELDFCSDNEPDIFISDVNEKTKQYAELKKIAYYNNYLNDDEKWYESFDKSIWDKVTYNGNVFAIPLENMYVCVYTNDEILKKCNINAYPETYEQLKNNISVIKNNNYIPFAFSTLENKLLLFNVIIGKYGGRFYSDYNVFGTDKINPNFIKSVQYLKEMYKIGAFPKDMYNMTENEINELFLNGKAAFIVRDSGFLNVIYNQENDIYKNVSVHGFPSIEGESSLNNSFLYGISKNSLFISSKAVGDKAKEKAIIRFIKYLTSIENTKKIKTGLGAITSAFANIYENDDVVAKFNGNFIYSFKETVDMPYNKIDLDSWNYLKTKLPMYFDDRIECDDLFMENRGS